MNKPGAKTTASEAMEARAKQHNPFNQVEGHTGSLGISFELEQAKDRLRTARENGNPERIKEAETYLADVRARKSAQAFNEVEGEVEGPMTEEFYLAQQADRNADRSPEAKTFANLAEEERGRLKRVAEKAADEQMHDEDTVTGQKAV